MMRGMMTNSMCRFQMKQLLIVYITILYMQPSTIVKSNPVDGNWSAWSKVTKCSSTCNDGVQTRNRACNNPSPLNGGNDCPGSHNETLPCNEGPCKNSTGNWSTWSNYSSCSVTCGNGYSFRNRTCDKTDLNDTLEAVCNGPNGDVVPCNEGQCPPINGSWSSWSNFSDCSVTCGGGKQSKIRSCDNPIPQNGGLSCEGQYIKSRACNEDGCPGFDNKGRRFIFGFMDNLGTNTGLTLIFTTAYDENIIITITTPLFDSTFIRKVSVRKGQVGYVSMRTSLLAVLGVVERKGILVEAERDIVVYAVNKEISSTDAYVVLPVDAIGQEYYVTSWNQNTAFMIIGTEDNTDISIKLGKRSPTIFYGGQTYSPQLQTLKLNLDKFETFYITHGNGDFTGSHVFGTKPVTLLAGSQCTSVGQGSCDHVVQQMLPIEKLGKDFITVGMPNCHSDDTFRIVSSQRNTVVNITGRPSITLTDPGDFYTFSLPDGEARTISADKGIQVTLFANGGCDSSSNGDPAMVSLPAIQQFSSDYTFSTVKLDGDDFINSLTLVIAESFIKGLRLDGTLLPNLTWRSVTGRSDIKYTDFIISSGSHSVYHVDPSVTFLAISTGIQKYNSYGYPVGFDFQRTIESCNDSMATAKDNSKSSGKSSCNINLDPCASVQCLNNGTCNPQGWTNFDCSCLKTYGGQLCEIDLCKPHPSDILFLMDTSQSMGSNYFEIQKQFIIDFMSNWTTDSEHFEVAVMLISETAVLNYNFGALNNKIDFAEKISNLKFRSGVSNIHLGIDSATTITRNRTRRVHFVQVKKFIILFSDGLPSSPSQITTFTDKDIILYTVAFGKDVSHFYLHKISGTFSKIFQPFNNRLRNHMLSDLIDPVCSVCQSSNKTDVILLVDASKNLDEDDVRTHIPEVLEQWMNKMGDRFIDTRLSLITFSRDIDIHFRFIEYKNKTRPLMHRHVHSIKRSKEKVSNFTETLYNVNQLFYNTTFGGRFSAKKILLIISKFNFEVDTKAKEVLNATIDVYTVGLNDENFEKMLLLAPTSFNVGIVGNFFADQIETYFDAFMEQLSHINCS